MKPTHIVIHHSLTADSQTVSWDAIRKYHLAQGWVAIGYHYGLELIGDHYEILKGRMDDDVGAHCKEQNMNARSIGICCVGNFDLVAPPLAQADMLVELVAFLMRQYQISVSNVKRHSDYATYKSCPGALFSWEEFIGRL
jgi:N-acetylmuramoyl-L-alanine amidase